MEKYIINCSSKILLACVLGLFAVLLPSRPSANPIDDLTVYTENFAPLNFEKEGQAQGIAVDLLLEMFRRAGSNKTAKDIQFIPWARGYKYAQHQKNTLLFAMMRTPAREDLFKWVGPIMPTNLVLIAKKGQGIQISPSTDLNKYRFGVVNNDVGEQLLLERGVNPDRMDVTNSSSSAAKMLNSNRFQMWAYGSLAAYWQFQKLGYDAADFEVVTILRRGEAHFALSRGSDDKIVEMLQKSLEEIRAEGRLKAIVNTYLPGYQ